MGDGAFGAVLMDAVSVDSLCSIFGVDGAETIDSFFCYIFDAGIFEAEVWTGAEVAVEFLYLMTLFILFVERAEVRLFFSHIFKVEVVDNLLF